MFAQLSQAATQSQSFTDLPINTIPFDDTYWLTLVRNNNSYKLQRFKNEVIRGAVAKNIYKKIKILYLGRFGLNYFSLGPFSSSEELETFRNRNKSGIEWIRNVNINLSPTYETFTGIDYKGIVSGSRLLKFKSCSFGFWVDPYATKNQLSTKNLIVKI